MKVLIVSPYLEIFDRKFFQFKAIAERIKELHIAYCSGSIEKEWSRYFKFHKFMNYEYDSKRVAFSKKLSRLPNLIRKSFISRILIKELRRFDIDLLYVLASCWQQILTYELAKEVKRPYICRLRGHLQYEIRIKQSIFFKAYYMSRIRNNLKNADLIIPITQDVLRSTLYFGIPREKFSDPIGLGVDSEIFYPMKKTPRKDLTLGYAGRLSKEKGIFQLVELAKKIPEIQINICGRLQERIKFPKNINYIGRIPHSEMVEFYNNCDIVILSSFTEGFPNVILEAYACEKPVLTTPQAMPKEMETFGYVADLKEWPRILREKDFSSIFGMRNYVKKNWTWKQFGDKMVKEFKGVLSNFEP